MSSKSTQELDSVSSNTETRILDAALHLLTTQGGAAVTMAQIAAAAGISRQAVYLHFADRAQLLVRLARYVDERRGLQAELRKVEEAPTGREALHQMASLQARLNPGVWPIVRAVEAIRRTDPAVEQAWQDRLDARLEQCRKVVARLKSEGALRKGLTPEVAADLLWTMTSLRAWEDLVLLRGWSAQSYERRLTALLLHTLTG